MVIVHEMSNMSLAVQANPGRYTVGIDSDTDSDPDADGTQKQLDNGSPARLAPEPAESTGPIAPAVAGNARNMRKQSMPHVDRLSCGG